jgi:outer membrane protein assembly factor BamB
MKNNATTISTFDRNYHFSDQVTFPLNMKWRFGTASLDRPLSQPLVYENRIWLLAALDRGGKPYGPAITYEIDALSGEKTWEYKIDQRSGWVSKNCIFKQQFITSTKDDIIGFQGGKISLKAEGLSKRTKSIVCDDQYLYYSRADGIFKINPQGELIKSFEKRRPSVLTLSDNKIIFGASSSVLCLSAEAMEIIWEIDLSEVGKYYHETDSHMLGKDVYKSGKLSGRYAVISGDKVFCDVGRNIVCLSFETGDVLWKGEAVGDPVCVGDRLISYDTVGNFYCLNPGNGELLFKTTPTEIHGLNASKPFVSGDTFFIGTDKIIAIDINNGELLWEYQSDQEETYFFDPVFIDGHLYTGCSDGFLYCFKCE